jgi:hypothetical protein
MRRHRGAWRIARCVCIAFAVLAAGFAVLELKWVHEGALKRGEVAYDALNMFAAGKHWLATGDLYYAHQLAGPYANVGAVNLYPPPMIVVFILFGALPAVLWWAVPMAMIAWSMTWLRPPWWTWPILATVGASLPVISAIVYGNSLMWVLALTCLATRWSIAGGILVFFKPTDALFGLPAARRLGFWVGVSIVLASALVTVGAWGDWISAMRNFQATPLYSISEWPSLAVPWLLLAIRHARSRAPQGQPVTAPAGSVPGQTVPAHT